MSKIIAEGLVRLYTEQSQHVVVVKVFETKEDMHDHYSKLTGKIEERDVVAYTTGKDWGLQDGFGPANEILLVDGSIDLRLIVHECTHAANDIYLVDYVKPKDEATKHYARDQEPIAYLMGDLVVAILGLLKDLNVKVSMKNLNL